MLPVFLFPDWLATLWWSAPLSVQYPITVLIYVLTLLGIRTLNSWVTKLWKDPIELIAYISILLSLVIVVAQFGYFALNQVSAPLATFAQDLVATTSTITPLTAPAVPLFVAIVILVFIVILGMWWLSQLFGGRPAGISTRSPTTTTAPSSSASPTANLVTLEDVQKLITAALQPFIPPAALPTPVNNLAPLPTIPRPAAEPTDLAARFAHFDTRLNQLAAVIEALPSSYFITTATDEILGELREMRDMVYCTNVCASSAVASLSSPAPRP
jgi:hypothetical protein